MSPQLQTVSLDNTAETANLHPTVSNSIALHLFVEVGNGAIFSDTLVHWMSTIYAVAFVQNTLTSGLIAFRLWRHERIANRIGGRSDSTDGSQTSLMPVMRIIVESAGIYVVVVLILIILYAIDSNAQYIVQEAFVPIVGTSSRSHRTRVLRDFHSYARSFPRYQESHSPSSTSALHCITKPQRLDARQWSQCDGRCRPRGTTP